MGKFCNRSFMTSIIILAMIAILTACGSNESEVKSNESEDMSMETEEHSESDGKMDKKDDENDHVTDQNDESKSDKNDEQADVSKSEMNGEKVTGNVASPLLQEGESVTYSFPNEGEYPIHCDPHPTMKMTVIVKPDASTAEHVELDIAGYEYSDKEVVIAPGTSITWTNKDLAEHNVAIVVE